MCRVCASISKSEPPLAATASSRSMVRVRAVAEPLGLCWPSKHNDLLLEAFLVLGPKRRPVPRVKPRRCFRPQRLPCAALGRVGPSSTMRAWSRSWTMLGPLVIGLRLHSWRRRSARALSIWAFVGTQTTPPRTTIDSRARLRRLRVRSVMVTLVAAQVCRARRQDGGVQAGDFVRPGSAHTRSSATRRLAICSFRLAITAFLRASRPFRLSMVSAQLRDGRDRGWRWSGPWPASSAKTTLSNLGAQGACSLVFEHR